MGSAKTAFDMMTLKLGMRPGLEARIADELLFDMPQINAEPVIIMGATSATALLVNAAINAGHRRFFIVGGKRVGDEDPKFTTLLNASLKELGLPRPSSMGLTEHEYGRELLHKHFGVSTQRIATRRSDASTNMQQNMEAIGRAGYVDRLKSMEIYTLAGAAHRVIGTARKAWKNATMPLAVHNVYPPGINRDNWMDDPVSRFFIVSEAGKVLAGLSGVRPEHERKGLCVPVNVRSEIARVHEYIGRQAQLNAGYVPPVLSPAIRLGGVG